MGFPRPILTTKKWQINHLTSQISNVTKKAITTTHSMMRKNSAMRTNNESGTQV